ncbi:MAG TPA: family 1 glycosylhydrolase [Anaerolineales bacterium]|nr:family 1 glycosylhydrolase [Anaerolineales bacterium]
MIQGTFHFPRGFLWGTATAAHQVEGGNTNNQWFAWEQAGRTKGLSGLACDWWGGRWREDFDRAQEGGQKVHRLSIEWSRIQPGPDQWDEHALDHYRSIVRGLRQRGMTAMITLHHFTHPLWLEERGAWADPQVVPLFERFVGKVVEALKEYCNLWCTINEPNVYAGLGYLVGSMPPGGGGLPAAIRVQANMARAHAAAYRLIHRLQPAARVGCALHFRPTRPRWGWFPPDVLMARLRSLAINLAFPSALSTGVMRTPLGRVRMPEVRGTQDFFGLNYYSADTAWFHALRPKELFTRAGYPDKADLSESGMIANLPHAFYDSIRWVVRTFPDLPIYITENGIDSSEDGLRRRYLAQHLHQIWRAVNFNWQIKGYLHWTLVDNFEWERGWTQRFGLYALDRETQKRTKRQSADLYAAVCKSNSLSSEMVRQHCPEVFDRIFPPFEG